MGKRPATAPRPQRDITALILKAVCAYRGTKGFSTIALKKELSFQGIDVEKKNRAIKGSIHWLLARGAIVQATPKGNGAMGSFKRGDAAELIKVELSGKPKAAKKSGAAKEAAKKAKE